MAKLIKEKTRKAPQPTQPAQKEHGCSPSPVPKKPSLQQFLELEKNYNTLFSQLQHAIKIANVPAEVPNGEFNLLKGGEKKDGCHARQEWVLRWLLEKLKNEDAVGSEARRSEKVWWTLAYLVNAVPISSAARLLSANKFLWSHETTLKEIVPGHQFVEAKEHNGINGEKNGNQDVEMSESSATVADEKFKPSKKRKRDSNGEEGAKVARRKVEKGAVSTELLRAIARCLQIIVSLTRAASAEDAVSAEHMKAVIRTTEDQAARLLALWSSAMILVLRDAEPSKDDAQSAPSLMDYEIYYEPMLAVWESKIPGPTGGFPVFIECVEPASHLLVLLESHPSDSEDEALHSSKQRIIKSLKQLLARHLFIPARTQFQATSRSRSGSKAGSENSPSLHALLRPLRQKISSSKGLPEENKAIIQCLPSLLSIAISSAHRKTPKQRLAEAAWLQFVFVELFSCTGIDTNDAGPSQQLKHGSPYLKAFEEMLQILLDRGVSLEEHTTEAIIRNVSGLLNQESDKVHWGIIAKILKLDANIFLPRKAAEAENEIPDALMVKIGSAFRKRPDEQANAPERLSDQAVDTSDISLLRPFREPNGLDYEILKRDVLAPLVDAYATARNMTGFVEQWEKQLVSTSHSASTPNRGISIWDDEDLFIALRPVLEASLTVGQISEILQAHLRRLQHLKEVLDTHNGKDTLSEISEQERNAYVASIIILDGLMATLRSAIYIEQLLPILLAVRDLYLDFVRQPAFQQDIISGHVFRALSRLFTLVTPLETSEHRETIAREFFKADYISSFANLNKAQCHLSSAVYSSALEAFEFIATVSNTVVADISDMQSTVRSELERRCQALFGEEKKAPFFFSISSIIAPNNRKMKGKPRPRSLVDYRLEAILLDYTNVFLRKHRLLGTLSSEARRRMFTRLYWYAFVERNKRYATAQGVVDTTFTDTLNRIIQTIFSAPELLPHEVKDDFLSVIAGSTTIAIFKKLPGDRQRQVINFTQETYLKISVASLKRSQRQAILDHALEECSWKKIEDVSLYLSLIVKLMEVPNATAKLSIDPKSIWTMSEAIDEGWQETPDLQVLELFAAAVDLVFGHIATDKASERSQSYLQTLISTMHFHLSSSYGFYRPATLCLFMSAISQPHIQSLIHSNEETSSLIQSYASNLCTSLRHLKAEAPLKTTKKELERIAMLEIILMKAVAELPGDCEVDAESWSDFLREIDSGWASPPTQKQDPILKSAHSAARFSAVVKHRPDSDIVHLAVHLLHQELLPKDRNTVLKLSSKNTAKKSLEEKATIISSLTSQNTWSIPHLELLKLVLSSLEVAAENRKEKLIPQELLTLLPHLCSQVATCKDFQTFTRICRCIKIITEAKPFLVTQHGLESLISTLTLLASSAAPALPSSNSTLIYIQICGLLTTIISLHRFRLRGRMHLLIPLLQLLLSLLFIPDTSSSHIPSHARFAPWTNLAVYSEASGTAFSRVLTTLTEPTVSSASGRSGKPGSASLVDETAKARQYVAQFVPALLQTYCTEALRGRLKPEVRKEVLVGLFACIGVVSGSGSGQSKDEGRDGLRAMSSGMGTSERGVWMGLYSEWRRAQGGKGE